MLPRDKCSQYCCRADLKLNIGLKGKRKASVDLSLPHVLLDGLRSHWRASRQNIGLPAIGLRPMHRREIKTLVELIDSGGSETN